ncbi:MAG: hypothetical protein CTY20_00705 [Hyphomicrobium sp.]|nr:MAG: hypothetical protein CTY20_00705 [Hyphomicrobium sp.]
MAPYTQDQILDLTGWSRSTLHRRRAAGEFPEAIDDTAKPLKWRFADVDRWFAENWEPDEADQQLMDRYPDDYATALADARYELASEVSDFYKDERDEVIQEVYDRNKDTAWEAAKAEVIEETIADDADREIDDYEAAAYEAWSTEYDSDAYRWQEATEEADTADIDKAIEGRLHAAAHVEAIKQLRKEIKQRVEARRAKAAE